MNLRQTEIILDIAEASKKAKIKIADLSYGDYTAHGLISPKTAARNFGSWPEARDAAAKADLAKLSAELKRHQQEAVREEKKVHIWNTYIDVLATTGKSPAMADLVQAGLSKDVIARVYGSLSVLEKEVRDNHPELFDDVHLHSLFSPRRFSALNDAVKKHKRFVITTAVTGCAVHGDFYAAIKNYCEAQDAALLVMVSSDPAHSRDHGAGTEVPKHERYGTISTVLARELIVLKDTALNDNLKLSVLKTSAKMINPLTGIKRLVQRNGNLIIASPKQIQQPVPVPNFKIPHIGMSTGAITVPDYFTENYMSERLAYIAENDHVIGALIVELDEDELFHFRQIQADTDGSFYDIAGCVLNKYTKNGVKAVNLAKGGAAALVMGDWHSGETDPVVAQAWKQLSAIISPDYHFVHDGFNGLSINHHEEGHHLLKVKRAEHAQLNLLDELTRFAEDIDEISTWSKKGAVIVKSNHDDFLYRYLDEGMYVEDPHNKRLALQLALAVCDDHDPLQYAVEEVIGLEAKTKVRWLKRNEDFKIARIQLGAHGDKGPSGSRGSLANMEESYGFSVTGHSHVAMILRGAWSVGTSSYLRLGYNEDSPSAWMNSSCIVYPNGQRQLINVIHGRFCLGGTVKMKAAA